MLNVIMFILFSVSLFFNIKAKDTDNVIMLLFAALAAIMCLK